MAFAVPMQAVVAGPATPILDSALATLSPALTLDPHNPEVAQHIDQPGEDAPHTAPQSLYESKSSSAAEAERLLYGSGHRSFHLRGDQGHVIQQVFKAFGVDTILDDSVRATPARFDLDDVDFETATEILGLATDAFFVPLDPHHALAARNSRENRARLERRLSRTFYFPGLTAKELTDMWNIAAKIVGASQSRMEPLQGTLTVRASEAELEALDAVYAELLHGRSVVQLDVRLYEIDRTRATNVGILLPASTTVFNVPSEVNRILESNAGLVDQILKEYPSLAGNDEAILAALLAAGLLTGTVFNGPFALFGGGLTETGIDLREINVNLLLNSSDARLLDDMQLRVLDQEEATIRSGERYPILISSFSTVAGASSSNNTIPQFQYEDLGLTLKATPHVESSDKVSLNLDMKLSSLAGTSLNNIPILANRQYAGIVSLGLGESAILVSDLSEQESLETTGVPGLGNLPGLSGATNRKATKDIMELAIVVTPHLVRRAHQGAGGSIWLLPRQ
ncbi:type II secretion system protein GspD [Occallatibacter riparius]|uniref:Type II and III secretion system protein n=1 Tax=Occallatibacter riparius TaxID=1002689 RepID=A0A9J7BIT3_9BACT|nr:type II and III secretion system protein [Occallatibacter riparius]UWZ82836.1 type II and III secretion system protein [Occallatibacter riparius]